MIWASLIVGIAGVVVAAAALFWTIHRDRAQTAALAAESEERKAADRREEERRDEELALLRADFERQEQREAEGRTAELVAEPGQTSGSEQGIAHTVRVRNVGASIARDVRVWLAERHLDGITGPCSLQAQLGTLVPQDDWISVDLNQPPPIPGGRVSRAGVIVAYWRDGAGEHRDVTIGETTIYR